MMQQLIKREADHVAIDRRHALQAPMLRTPAYGVVQGRDLFHGAFEQITRKTFHICVELLGGKKSAQHVFRRVLSNFPLEEHLQGELTSFATRTHPKRVNKLSFGPLTLTFSYFPTNFGGLFSRKARVPSLMSAVVQQRPNSVASRNSPWASDISMP